MTTAAILAELTRLTLAELAQVKASVDELVGTGRRERSVGGPARVYSPRLADPAQAAQLVKRVVVADAEV